MFFHADSEDSDQSGRMSRLICVFAERNGHFVGFVMRRLMFTLQLCSLASRASLTANPKTFVLKNFSKMFPSRFLIFIPVS